MNFDGMNGRLVSDPRAAQRRQPATKMRRSHMLPRMADFDET